MDRDALRPAVDPGAGALEHALRVVPRRRRARRPSSPRPRRRDRRAAPRTSPARTRRELVVDRRERCRLRRRAARGRRWSRSARPSGEAARRCAPSDAPRATRRRRARSGRSARRGSPGAAASACRRSGSRSARPARAGRAGRRRGRVRVSTSSSTTSAPRARIAAIVASVSAERPKPETWVGPSQIAPSMTARCEIDLSPGTATCPSRAATGSMRIRAESRVPPDSAPAASGTIATCGSSPASNRRVRSTSGTTRAGSASTSRPRTSRRSRATRSSASSTCTRSRVEYDPEELRERSLDLLALLVATGLDPERSTIFAQSHVTAHAEANWLLSSVASFGELRRMTQFKDKSDAQEFVSGGALHLPGADGRRHPPVPDRRRPGRRRPAPARRADPRRRDPLQLPVRRDVHAAERHLPRDRREGDGPAGAREEDVDDRRHGAGNGLRPRPARRDPPEVQDRRDGLRARGHAFTGQAGRLQPRRDHERRDRRGDRRRRGTLRRPGIRRIQGGRGRGGHRAARRRSRSATSSSGPIPTSSSASSSSEPRRRGRPRRRRSRRCTSAWASSGSSERAKPVDLGGRQLAPLARRETVELEPRIPGAMQPQNGMPHGARTCASPGACAPRAASARGPTRGHRYGERWPRPGAVTPSSSSTPSRSAARASSPGVPSTSAS